MISRDPPLLEYDSQYIWFLMLAESKFTFGIYSWFEEYWYKLQIKLSGFDQKLILPLKMKCRTLLQYLLDTILLYSWFEKVYDKWFWNCTSVRNIFSCMFRSTCSDFLFFFHFTMETTETYDSQKFQYCFTILQAK